MANRLGQQFGNYRLIRLLGTGGFAEVYLGQHVRLSTQQAAIKILTTRLQEEHIRMFEREAVTIAALVHPHIVRVLDFDITEGIPFLVMDYAPHGSLRQRHARGEQVPLPTVVSYVQCISSALQYAHDKRFIHRDVKPDNMLITAHNEIVLSDFGIAAVAHSTSSQHLQGTEGTIPYMAPEQLQEHPRFASDQYALGITIYEWLAGERPFSGSFTEIAVKHSMVPPPPLRDKQPALPPAVEQVVMTALAKDPRDRFPSVEAFARALEQASQSAQPDEERMGPTGLAKRPFALSEQTLQRGDPHLTDKENAKAAMPVSSLPASGSLTSPLLPSSSATPAISLPVRDLSSTPTPEPTPPSEIPRHKARARMFFGWRAALLVLLALLVLGTGSYELLSNSQSGQASNHTGGTSTAQARTSVRGTATLRARATTTSTTRGSPTAVTTPTSTLTGGSNGVTATGTVTTSKTYYMKEVVTYSNTATITAMTITITVQKTTGVSYNGAYATGTSVTATHVDNGSTIVYTYTLNSGQTRAPDTNQVAAQFNLTGTAHSTTDDRWSITTTSGGVTNTASGHF
jgi:serine/threonine protein kinase